VEDAFLSWRGLFLPKRGHSAQEYEDAFAADPVTGRFAVADGASESSYAGPWAQIVVDCFVGNSGAWTGWLPAARARWLEMFHGKELPWYAEEKFEQGAFCTVLGLNFEKLAMDSTCRWRASAVGDSCLFQIRNDSLHRAFPLARSADFDNRPDLLGSRTRALSSPRTKRKQTTGDWLPGDLLLLMTDALAQWFLERAEAGQRPWKALQGLCSKEELTGLIDDLRDRKAMRNDDVTLLAIAAT
jgi:hypothetical protein